MHVSRGGWLGQTFALAKLNDSFDGKKSGTRRSKEERKGMVETFIKRYQKLNNGDFPSLNLTRKEVGGSFYTVREIVREIIQENRVLGPPKSPPGDRNMENLDSFLENSPLGSMSVDLHVHLVPPKDNQTLLEDEFKSEKVMNTRSITELHQSKLESDKIVDGTMNKTERNEDKGDEEMIYVGRSQISRRDVAETTHVNGNNETLDKTKNTELLLEGGMEEQKDQVNELVANKSQKHEILRERKVLDGDLVDIKSEESITHSLPESKPTFGSQKGQNRLATKENNGFDFSDNTDIQLGDTMPAEEKTANGGNAQNLHSRTPSISVQQSALNERSASLNKSTGGNSQKNRTDATLNRINLESWKAASKESSGRESHQLVTFIKAFITAFVKFWSE